MFCTSCGTKLEASSKFCPSCGARTVAPYNDGTHASISSVTSLISRNVRATDLHNIEIRRLVGKVEGERSETDWTCSAAFDVVNRTLPVWHKIYISGALVDEDLRVVGPSENSTSDIQHKMLSEEYLHLYAPNTFFDESDGQKYFAINTFATSLGETQSQIGAAPGSASGIVRFDDVQISEGLFAREISLWLTEPDDDNYASAYVTGIIQNSNADDAEVYVSAVCTETREVYPFDEQIIVSALQFMPFSFSTSCKLSEVADQPIELSFASTVASAEGFGIVSAKVIISEDSESDDDDDDNDDWGDDDEDEDENDSDSDDDNADDESQQSSAIAIVENEDDADAFVPVESDLANASASVTGRDAALEKFRDSVMRQTRADEFHIMPDIPADLFRNAVEAYVRDANPDEKAILLIDTTVLRSAKGGLLMTSEAIYSKDLGSTPRKIPLNEVRYVNARSGLLTRTLIINGDHEIDFSGVNGKAVTTLAGLLNDLASDLKS